MRRWLTWWHARAMSLVPAMMTAASNGDPEACAAAKTWDSSPAISDAEGGWCDVECDGGGWPHMAGWIIWYRTAHGQFFLPRHPESPTGVASTRSTPRCGAYGSKLLPPS